MQKTNMIRTWGIHITLRLSHIHFFFKQTMKECIAYIQLFKIPTIVNCQSKKQSHSSRFHHRTKGLIIIQAILLEIIPCHQLSFIPCYSPITVPFQLKNPFTSNMFLSTGRGTRDQVFCLRRDWNSESIAATHWGYLIVAW